eukprot:TRINITY_DN47092_c0_g1_i1.p1 TRINITY_DN47092_c0_g1~~TRINITY_DN47092_c0_g1_i1.p1  ORF type:complete len:263 (+),score=29.44 TRINITY_DN47092_c0_g1_i1:68-856(+)
MMFREHGGSSYLRRLCVWFVSVCVCSHFAHRLVLQQVAGYRLRLDEISSVEKAGHRLDGRTSETVCPEALDFYFDWGKTEFHLTRVNDGKKDGAKFFSRDHATEDEKKTAVPLALIGTKEIAVLVDETDDGISCLSYDGKGVDKVKTENLFFQKLPSNGRAKHCVLFQHDSEVGNDGTIYHPLHTDVVLEGDKDTTKLFLSASGTEYSDQWVELVREKDEHETTLRISRAKVHTELMYSQHEDGKHLFLRPCIPSDDEDDET